MFAKKFGLMNIHNMQM